MSTIVPAPGSKRSLRYPPPTEAAVLLYCRAHTSMHGKARAAANVKVVKKGIRRVLPNGAVGCSTSSDRNRRWSSGC